MIWESSWGSETVWTGFKTAQDGSNKVLYDDGAGPTITGVNIFNSVGGATSEYNGTDTNPPGTTIAQAGSLLSSDKYWRNHSGLGGADWENDGVGLIIDEDTWGVWEFWFEVADEFATDDEPEAKYWNDSGGGGVELLGLRWSYLVSAGVEVIERSIAGAFGFTGAVGRVATFPRTIEGDV